MHKRKYIRTAVILIMVMAVSGTAVYLLVQEGRGKLHPDLFSRAILAASVSGNKAQNDIPSRREQEPLKVKNKQEVQDFRLTQDDEYATLRDEIFFTTSKVVDLEPDTARSTFRPGQKVYVFAALKAPREERVKFTWYGPGGKEILPSAYFDVEPNMGPVGFRIFSYRSFRRPGTYSVAVFNSAGSMIGESDFTVQ